MDPPLISIILPTYNRSDVLRFAIESVLEQRHVCWELWVVGDACTDDSQQVVESFGDNRIRFHNLERNSGEPARPTNAGEQLATGDFFAWLHHDDIWLPEHLETALDQLRANQADMVFTRWARIAGPDDATQVDEVPGGRFLPLHNIIPSAWLATRSFTQAIGPWPTFAESLIIPSQQRLFRGWKKGKKMLALPDLTMLHFPSRTRPNSYIDADATEQSEHWQRIGADADGYRNWLAELPQHKWRKKRLDRSLLMALKIHPDVFREIRRGRWKSRQGRKWRRANGLEVN